jgi:hypothetical protein
MSVSRVRENRTHGSMRGREAPRCRRPSGPKGRRASRPPDHARASEARGQTPASAGAGAEAGALGALPPAVAFALVQSRSPALADIIGWAARTHSLDDLLRIDPLEIDGGRAEIGIPELPLDEVQGHTQFEDPSPRHIIGRVLRDTQHRFRRERHPYAGEVPARGSASEMSVRRRQWPYDRFEQGR